MKRKLTDVAKKLEILYDKLRANSVSIMIFFGSIASVGLPDLILVLKKTVHDFSSFFSNSCFNFSATPYNNYWTTSNGSTYLGLRLQ